MKKTTKVWLLIAAALVLTGSLIFGAVIGMVKWDFTKLSTNKYETNQYDIDESFRNISIQTDTADIEFVLSEDGKCKVECYEEKEATHSVSVAEDTLVIKIDNRKAWYHYIGVHFGSPSITVYLPSTDYGNLSIHKNTGNIKLPADYAFDQMDISLTTGNVSCFASASGQIKIKASTGNITANGITAKSIDLSTSTGDISLKDVIAAEAISLKTTTGKVSFDGMDASEIYVNTTTGKVVGSLLTDKVFITHTSTGNIDVPDSVVGGRCEIHTTTGSIQVTVE